MDTRVLDEEWMTWWEDVWVDDVDDVWMDGSG